MTTTTQLFAGSRIAACLAMAGLIALSAGATPALAHGGGGGGGGGHHSSGGGFGGSSGVSNGGMGSSGRSTMPIKQDGPNASGLKNFNGPKGNFDKPLGQTLKSQQPARLLKTESLPKITSNRNLRDAMQSGKLTPLTSGAAAKRINLAEQYKLAGKGDVSRRLGLPQKLQAEGGWYKRTCGPMSSDYLKHCKGQCYCGPWWCPGTCWTPVWAGWVDWSFNCQPWFDPRPDYCQPISCETAVDELPAPVDIRGESESWIDDNKPVEGAQGGAAAETVSLDLTSGRATDDERQATQESSTTEGGPVDYDLQLVAVRFVDNGHAEKQFGPRYRVWVRNAGQKPIEQPFTVAVQAAGPTDETAKPPHAGRRIKQLDAGQLVAVDVRLPIEANETATLDDGRVKPKYPTLQVAVDVRNEITESTKENNAAAYPRSKLPMVDPAVFAADSKQATAGQTIDLAGEGLGPEAGEVLVRVGGLEMHAEIEGWYDLGARVKLPSLPLASATDAELVLVRGDGAATNPLPLQLAATQSAAPPIAE